MKKQRKIMCSILFLFSIVTYSQESKQEVKIDVTKIYLKVAESGYQSEEVFSKLGNIFYFESDYVNAEKWYKKLYEFKEGDIDPNYIFRYSKSLKAIGNLEYSKELYQEFLKKKKSINTKKT